MKETLNFRFLIVSCVNFFINRFSFSKNQQIGIKNIIFLALFTFLLNGSCISTNVSRNFSIKAKDTKEKRKFGVVMDSVKKDVQTPVFPYLKGGIFVTEEEFEALPRWLKIDSSLFIVVKKEDPLALKGFYRPTLSSLVTDVFLKCGVSYRGGYHLGIDLRGRYLEPVFACDDGVVTFISKYGYKYIEITHDYGQIVTRYGHTDKFSVKKGQRVKKGQLIARIGRKDYLSTAPHLHLEVKYILEDGWVHYFDPLEYFPDFKLELKKGLKKTGKIYYAKKAPGKRSGTRYAFSKRKKKEAKIDTTASNAIILAEVADSAVMSVSMRLTF